MRKAVIYARYSPRPGHKTPGETIEMQFEKCRHYAAARDLEVVGEFKDEMVSGAAPVRKGFDQAMRACQEVKGVFIVYSITRFGRSLEITLRNHRVLQDNRCELASVKEVIDTTTASGRLMFAIQSAMAEFYREQISEATRDAFANRKRKRLYCGGKLPYGWALGEDGETLVPDDLEQVIISLVSKLHQEEGLSLRQIADKLNHLGYPTRTNQNWDRQKVFVVSHADSAS